MVVNNKVVGIILYVDEGPIGNQSIFYFIKDKSIFHYMHIDKQGWISLPINKDLWRRLGGIDFRPCTISDFEYMTGKSFIETLEESKIDYIFK